MMALNTLFHNKIGLRKNWPTAQHSAPVTSHVARWMCTQNIRKSVELKSLDKCAPYSKKNMGIKLLQCTSKAYSHSTVCSLV